MKKLNSNGFGHLEVALLVVAVVVVGCTGYLVWHHGQKPKYAATTSSTTASTNPASTASTTAPNTVAGLAQTIDGLTASIGASDETANTAATATDATNAQSTNAAATNVGGAYNASNY